MTDGNGYYADCRSSFFEDFWKNYRNIRDISYSFDNIMLLLEVGCLARRKKNGIA